MSPPIVSRAEDRTRVSNKFGHRKRKGCPSVDNWLRDASDRILNHMVWKALIILFTIVLLFGPPLQLWFIPAATMNILYFLGFFIFVVDMILNFYFDPNYLRLGSCRPKGTVYVNQEPCFLDTVGSFSFWCDFASTICFLLEINLIYKRRFESITYVIQVNEFGFPNPEAFAEATYAENPFYRRGDSGLIILIFKTLRVARLVRPKRVVDISTKLNIFWYLVRLNPSYYWKLCRKRRAGAKRIKKNSSLSRSSWGRVEIAAISMVKSMKEEEEEMIQKGKFAYAGYMLKRWAENTLRFLHILPSMNVSLKRQIAAIRIQRAWRNRCTTHGLLPLHPEEDGGSHAWRSLRDSYSSSHLTGVPGRYSRIGESIHRPSRDNTFKSLEKRISRQKSEKKADSSQVGTAMAEVTGRSVALFLLLNLLLTLLLTYTELDSTAASTMVILHGQTTSQSTGFAWKAVETARRSTIPKLYLYSVTSIKNDIDFTWTFDGIPNKRPLNTKNITVVDERGGRSTGLFNDETCMSQKAQMEMTLLVCILLVWFFGVAAFAGPITTLVVNPIERAVQLLSMLVMDPLGYQNSLKYKNFLTESDKVAESGRWSRQVLKGMETEFLMSSIVRIGSLMKVGFGSAGAQIIRNNLQKSHENDTGTMMLSSQGKKVSCIFMFCDIRSFTDATECLQEEVFVFTNQIAAVVHSICNCYSGSTNKNIGDAFLVSWKLDRGSAWTRKHGDANAKLHQADKALLSVVKISIALHYDDFYVGLLSNHARKALLTKFKDRPGPIVQLGFGLHAGTAIEGAIGSQRKIDATYVSMAVETAEYLETSTKKYNVNMLMSCSFHRLLQPSRQQRCRKIDRLIFEDEDDEDDDVHEELVSSRQKVIEVFTYDIDVDALFDGTQGDGTEFDSSGIINLKSDRRRSSWLSTSQRSSRSGKGQWASRFFGQNEDRKPKPEPKQPRLVLPTGHALYSENIWLQPDIRCMRRRYTTDFFDTFNLGLQKYYSKEWDEARTHFEANLNRFDDGPSRYFLNLIEKHGGTPPDDFKPFGVG